MNVAKLRVSTKLWLAVFLFIATISSIVVFTAWRSGQVTAKSEVTISASNAKVRTAMNWAATAETVITRLQALVASSNDELSASFRQANARDQQRIAAWQKELETAAQTTQERAQMEKIARERELALKHVQALEERKAAGDVAGATAIFIHEMTPALQLYLQSLRDFVQMHESAAQALRKDLADERATTIKIASALMVAILVCMVAGARMLIRSIHEPLQHAVVVADRIAQGDLTARINTARADEFGDMMRAMHRMNDALSTVVGQVRKGADSVVGAASQIAAGNLDLSARTEEQASALEETASSMEQLTGTVKHNADNARHANQLAASASDVATKGGTVVSEVVRTMGSINDSSKKIVDIISVIDGIAFQTNILALNAAVEAARAGEQGRGFAVVASEVRSLAQRSAGAAKEIKALINDSVEKVGAGAALVEQAGGTMQEIVESIRRVTDIMGEITAASAEQTTGLEQISQAISQMDETTQQNASLVEQAAAAAEAMREQAVVLAQAVSSFSLDETHAASAAAPAQARAIPAAAAKPASLADTQAKARLSLVVPARTAADDDWKEF